MREIKFRAWDKKGKVWLEWGFFDLFQILKNDRYVVVQYTGLLDKKGKEIYEGDIVKDNEGAVRRIKWENGSFWARESIVGHLASMIDDKIMYDPEIIGNIYENPELLN